MLNSDLLAVFDLKALKFAFLYSSLVGLKCLSPVPLGSIPELPADSCEEILASEGEKAVSGSYWLDFNRSGNSLLTHCNMGMRGKQNRVFLSHSEWWNLSNVTPGFKPATNCKWYLFVIYSWARNEWIFWNQEFSLSYGNNYTEETFKLVTPFYHL